MLATLLDAASMGKHHLTSAPRSNAQGGSLGSRQNHGAGAIQAYESIAHEQVRTWTG